MFFLEGASLDSVDLAAALVPLERVQTLGQLVAERTLDVVVHPEIPFDQVLELADDFVGILVQQALQLAHFFVVVEVLFVLGVQVGEDVEVVFERLNQFVGPARLGKIGRHLQLLVLLFEPAVELGQLRLDVVLNVLLLVAHDLENFVFELRLSLHGQFVELFKHRVHQRRQVLEEGLRRLLTVLYFFIQVPEVTLEIRKAFKRSADHSLL